MGQFDQIVKKFIVVALVFLGVFSLIITTQSSNDAQDPLSNNKEFSEIFGNLTATIDSSSVEANQKYGVFNEENPKVGFGSIVLFGIVSVGKSFSTIIFGIFEVIIKLPLIILGVPPSVYNLIITWLIIVVIVAVWLLYKLGG